MSTLYLICPQGERLTKIGITTNLEARLRQLQTAYPHPLHVAASWEFEFIEEARDFEHFLHERFAHWKTSGEWFRFEADEIAKLVAHIYSIGGMRSLVISAHVTGFSLNRLNKAGLAARRYVALQTLNAIDNTADALGINLSEAEDFNDETTIGDLIMAEIFPSRAG